MEYINAVSNGLVIFFGLILFKKIVDRDNNKNNKDNDDCCQYKITKGVGGIPRRFPNFFDSLAKYLILARLFQFGNTEYFSYIT